MGGGVSSLSTCRHAKIASHALLRDLPPYKCGILVPGTSAEICKIRLEETLNGIFTLTTVPDSCMSRYRVLHNSPEVCFLAAIVYLCLSYVKDCRLQRELVTSGACSIKDNTNKQYFHEIGTSGKTL